MSYTRAELATRSLKDLGLVGGTETPSAEDLAWAEETVSAEVATMASLDMPIWNGSDLSIPLEYLGPLSRRIGLAMAASFGMIDPVAAMAAMEKAEGVLALLGSARGSTPLTLQSNDATGSRGSFSFTSGR